MQKIYRGPKKGDILFKRKNKENISNLYLESQNIEGSRKNMQQDGDGEPGEMLRNRLKH